MFVTYAGAANNTTNGVALGAAGQDVRVYSVFIGNPVASGNVYLTTITNPIGASVAAGTTAFRVTLPATLPTTGANAGTGQTYTFGPYGLPLNDGGNLVIDQAMQVTVVWGIADNSQI